MTEQEKEVLEALGRAFNLFSALEHYHPADLNEFVIHIHGAQNIILAREGLRSLKGKS